MAIQAGRARTNRPIDLSVFAGLPTFQKMAERITAGGSALTVDVLEREFKKASREGSPDAEVIRQMRIAASSPQRGKSFLSVAGGEDVSTKEESAEDAQFRSVLDRFVIGQDFAKNALVRFKKTLDSGLDNTPKSLVIGGPPG